MEVDQEIEDKLEELKGKLEVFRRVKEGDHSREAEHPSHLDQGDYSQLDGKLVSGLFPKKEVHGGS